uniref:Antitermination protein Q n=1 Tax=Marinobacter nauticus TaxID=2743 RepID=A0A455WD94_MARNT|nr:hypothetical protein YBY_16400 [Marinobacter nauticus]
MLDDTKNRLQEWGEWVRSGGPSLGYSSVKLASGTGGCTVADDEALAVDRAVASLKHREPCMGKVLVNYYVRRWDYSMIGLDVHMSREKVRVLLRSGEAWVDGSLSRKAG